MPDRDQHRAEPVDPLPAARAVWTPASKVSTSAMIATGMLIQKIARQVHWVR